jgi:hypothetical protein
MTRRIYSAALMAQGGGYGVSVTTSAYIARSVEEARGMALAQCQEVFPEAEGYGFHKVSVLAVPPLWYNLRPHMKRTRRVQP